MSTGVGKHAGPARHGGRAGGSEGLPGEADLARRAVAVLGGRYSAEVGIDVDAGDTQVERWFVAATLFGARIPARAAERAFGVLAAAGLTRIGQFRHVPSAALIEMLDAGGYARYDIRTAERLLQLCEVIRDRYDGQAAVIGRRFTAYPDLRAALRELRGTWPGARPPLDERAAAAARHLGLTAACARLPGLAGLAAVSGLDVRDLESGLVRLALAHGGAMACCPGGQACTVLRPPGPGER